MTFASSASTALFGLLVASASLATSAQAHDFNSYQMQPGVPAMTAHGTVSGDRSGQSEIEFRLSRLDRRLDIGTRQGRLTRHESRDLRNDLYEISRLSRSWSLNGLSRQEYDVLSYRIDRLERQIAVESHDDDRRHLGYGYGYGAPMPGYGRGW